MKIVPAAEPLVFGEGSDLMGWYHAPSPSHARDLGVVVCAPKGYDELCVHWGLRILCERLAAEGIPTVRFDYHGTGNSLGGDALPGRVPAWLASIGEAIALLKAKSGVTRVALFGIRLGGTLAAVTASEREDIELLVLYAPCASGRTYVREQKALGLTSHGGEVQEKTGNPNDVLMAGWLITEETAAALGKIDLTKLPKLNAKHVLLLHREDMPVDERVQKQLEAAGARVMSAKAHGYSAFMQDALKSKLPEPDFATMIAWLIERSASAVLPAPKAIPRALLQGDTFTEEPVWFANGALFGVLCLARAPARDQPIVVFTNTAANHHIGTHRATVDMGRALASRGIGSFRFDIDGIGDSPARPGRVQNQIYQKTTIGDVVSALDFLQSRGLHNLSVTGLCSGGYLAFHTAVLDRRARTAVLVNTGRWVWRDGDSLDRARQYAVPSTDTYVERALKPETWIKLAKGSVDLKLIGTALAARGLKQLRGRAAEVAARVLGPSFEVDEVPRAFLQLLERGVHVLLVYSGRDGGLEELSSHLGPNLRRLRGHPKAKLVQIPDSDHTLTTAASRAALVELLANAVSRS